MSEYVYIMSTASYKGWVKVGYTKRKVEERRKELSSSSGVKDPFKVEHVFEVANSCGEDSEKMAHKALSQFTKRKEFFHCEAIQAINILTNIFESYSSINISEKKQEVLNLWRENKQLKKEIERINEEERKQLSTLRTKLQCDRERLISFLKTKYESTIIRNKIIRFCIYPIAFYFINLFITYAAGESNTSPTFMHTIVSLFFTLTVSRCFIFPMLKCTMDITELPQATYELKEFDKKEEHLLEEIKKLCKTKKEQIKNTMDKNYKIRQHEQKELESIGISAWDKYK